MTHSTTKYIQSSYNIDVVIDNQEVFKFQIVYFSKDKITNTVSIYFDSETRRNFVFFNIYQNNSIDKFDQIINSFTSNNFRNLQMQLIDFIQLINYLDNEYKSQGRYVKFSNELCYDIKKKNIRTYYQKNCSNILQNYVQNYVQDYFCIYGKEVNVYEIKKDKDIEGILDFPGRN